MKTFKEFVADNGVEYLVIEMTLTDVTRLGLIAEGGWRDAHISGWQYRIDPERPEMNQMRHVHVARSRHTGAKSQQASWNADGSRHDGQTFNQKTGSVKAARDVARRALRLPSDALLEDRALRLLSEALVLGTQSAAQFFLELKQIRAVG